MHKLTKVGRFRKNKSLHQPVEGLSNDELLSRNVFYIANIPDYPQDDISGMIRRAVKAAKGRKIEIINFEREIHGGGTPSGINYTATVALENEYE